MTTISSSLGTVLGIILICIGIIVQIVVLYYWLRFRKYRRQLEAKIREVYPEENGDVEEEETGEETRGSTRSSDEGQRGVDKTSTTGTSKLQSSSFHEFTEYENRGDQQELREDWSSFG
jgi:hypothetical protein